MIHSSSNNSEDLDYGVFNNAGEQSFQEQGSHRN